MTLTSLTAALVAALCLPWSVQAQSASPRFTSGLRPGPYAAGFRVVEQYDAARIAADRIEFAANPERVILGRPMPTFIWYPARAMPGSTPMRFRDYAELYAPAGTFAAHDESGRRTAVAGLLRYLGQPDSSALLVQHELASTVRAFRNAPQAPGKFPLVIYAPGSGAPATQNEFLGEYLASHGYIFVASPSWGPGDPSVGPASGAEHSARDVEYLLAFARTLPNAEPARTALMGQSLGGAAVVLVASRNASVSAIVSLDGTMVYHNSVLSDAATPRALRGYSVPSLFMTQAIFTPEMRRAFRADSTFAFFDSLRYADAYRVFFPRLRHRNFNSLTNRLLAPGQIFLGNDTLEFNPNLAVASADYDVMATYALNFLNAYVKGDSAGLTFLSRGPADHGFAPSGVTMVHKKPWPDRFVLMRRLQSASVAEIGAEREQLKARLPGYSDLDAESLNDWAVVLNRIRPTDALAGSRVLTTLYPTFAAGFQTAGLAHLRAAGDSAAAVRYFRRALELDSSRVYLKEWITQYQPRTVR